MIPFCYQLAAGLDYSEISGRLLDFSQDIEEHVILVLATSDVLVESDETFLGYLTLVTLDVPGVSIAPSQAAVTITDDDRKYLHWTLQRTVEPLFSGHQWDLSFCPV